jgi:hypothetical protein
MPIDLVVRGEPKKQNNSMTKTQQNLKKTPIPIGIGIILSVFIGIFTAVAGINNIENYFEPYLFGGIFGGIGLVLGVLTALKLKPYITVNKRQQNNYTLPIMFISVGFIGVFLLTGSLLNQKLSKFESYDHFTVSDKYRQEARFRSPEINTLVVNMKGDTVKLVCSFSYWDRIAIGQEINLCIYKSKIGFDYVELTDDNK